MEGVSNMLPFVVAGGILIALSFIWGINSFNPEDPTYNLSLIHIFFLIFGLMARKMGTPLMFKTMMATAHDLLLNTVFFIMAMAVIAGAISALLSEFGAIALINKIFAPLMRPLWGMPGASVTGAIAVSYTHLLLHLILKKKRL